MARRRMQPHKRESGPVDGPDPLLDAALERLRREVALLPQRLPTPEDVAKLQEMLASHRQVVTMVTGRRHQAPGDKGGPETKSAP